MKKLNIKSENCLMQVSCVGIDINKTGLEELIKDNLPKLKEYRDYPVKLDVSIEFLGDEKLIATPTGYKIPKEVEKDE